MALNEDEDLVCDCQETISDLHSDVLEVVITKIFYVIVSVEPLDEAEDAIVCSLGFVVLEHVAPELRLVICIEDIEGLRFERGEALLVFSLVIFVFFSFA